MFVVSLAVLVVFSAVSIRQAIDIDRRLTNPFSTIVGSAVRTETRVVPREGFEALGNPYRIAVRTADPTSFQPLRSSRPTYSTLRCKMFSRNSATASRRAMSFFSLASTLPTACMTVV